MIFLRFITNDWNNKEFLQSAKFCPIGIICTCPKATLHVLNYENSIKIREESELSNEWSDKVFLLPPKFLFLEVVCPCPRANIQV